MDSTDKVGHTTRCGRGRVFSDWEVMEGLLVEVILEPRPE